MVECPVNRRRTRCVVRDEHDLFKPQLVNDRIYVADLIGGGIWITGRLIRTAPAKKIKQDDSAWRRKVRNQTVVEVQVVREPMHQDYRRFCSWIISDVDPVLVTPHKTLLVGHNSLPWECVFALVHGDRDAS